MAARRRREGARRSGRRVLSSLAGRRRAEGEEGGEGGGRRVPELDLCALCPSCRILALLDPSQGVFHRTSEGGRPERGWQAGGGGERGGGLLRRAVCALRWPFVGRRLPAGLPAVALPAALSLGPAPWLVGWRLGCFVGWLAPWLVGGLAPWLVGWLAPLVGWSAPRRLGVFWPPGALASWRLGLSQGLRLKPSSISAWCVRHQLDVTHFFLEN